MDELIKKIEELRKGLLSLKQPQKQDFFVPAIKPPSIPKPSMKPTGKIPGGLPPPSKKDPRKVAEQLKNPQPGKVQVEVLKVEDNGQWTLRKGFDEKTPKIPSPSTPASPATRVSGAVPPARQQKMQALRAPVNQTEGFANWHSPEQNKLIHGLDFANAKPMNGSVAGGAQEAVNPVSNHNVILKRAADHANQQERGHLENGFNSAKREVLFHNMAHNYFGMGKHVPTTAGFTRNGDDYSAQHKVENASHADLTTNHDDMFDENPKPKDFKSEHHAKILNDLHQGGDLHKLALMDHLMGHHDRHGGNYMMDDKNLHLVDNGTAFDYKNFDTKHYPAYLDHSEAKHINGMGKDNTTLHPAAQKWLQGLDPQKAKEFFATHGHDENSSTTQGFLRRLQGLKNSVNNGPEHYKSLNNVLDKNRLTSGPLHKHPEQVPPWQK